MKPPPFAYLRPETPEEALAALASEADSALLLAGGQSLMAMLNMRLAQPSLLIDIGSLGALSYVRISGGALAVGAASTQSALEHRSGLVGEAPLLAQALPHLGHYQTRNRGTVCGSIAHADPSGELPLCLVALKGEVALRSVRERRIVQAEQFFLGALSTTRRPDEMIEEARFPLRRKGEGHAFRELSMRQGDFAICAVAASATADGLRLAVGGVADRPVARDWPLLEGGTLDDALSDFAWDLEARDDMHASARYRRMLVRKLGRAALEEAMSCRNG
ncbi:MAG TPA: FAD binding domain-containing protein [Candidatus Cybelea sp.]|nr:FAD binding domain-containing protein [Candidatus Cybelea sp.]